MTQLVVSLFNDRSGSAINAVPVSWADFVANFSNAPVQNSKAECQLFSLCEFGDKRTENNSLRSNENVLGVWGAVGDYDGEKVQPQQAAQALAAAGVRALVYTSPSHTPSAPRFRVIAPFETRRSPEEHAAAIERLNTIVGGGLSSESFTLSQPYYIGRVAGSEAHFMALVVEGNGITTIDTRADIPRTPWRGSGSEDTGYRVPTEVLIDDLQSGIEIHPAIVALAARGYTQEQLTELVKQAMDSWGDRRERGYVAIEQDIPRAVSSWERKKKKQAESEAQRIEAIVQSTPAPPIQKGLFTPAGNVLFGIDDFIGQPTPQNWLIKGVIEDKSHISVFGDSGAGKSFLVIDWALSIAAGREWNGRKVSQGGVVYLNGEGFDGWRRRVAAWVKHNKVKRSELNGFRATKRCWPLTNKESVDKVWGALDAIQADVGSLKLVIVDTFNRHVMGMDINSSTDMGKIVGLCDEIRARYGCSVLVVHHAGTKDKDRGMGSVALKAALDVEINVRRKGQNVTAIASKMKDSEPFPDMHFKLTDVFLDWPANPEAGPNEIPEPQKAAVLTVIENPEQTGEGNTPGQVGRPNKTADTVREVLREGRLIMDQARDDFCAIHGGARETASRAFNRAIKSMSDAGAVIWNKGDDTVALPLSFITDKT